MEAGLPEADGIFLGDLKLGMPGIESPLGESFAHAASVCLETGRHESGVTMPIEGDIRKSYPVFWEGIDDQVRRSWADLQDATEMGAYGIAALVIVKLTEFTVIERARKGKGFDYWLGPKNKEAELFQNAARMEVSGILIGDEGEIERRVRAKLAQVKPSPGRHAAFIVVVEFGGPRTKMVRK